MLSKYSYRQLLSSSWLVHVWFFFHFLPSAGRRSDSPSSLLGTPIKCLYHRRVHPAVVNDWFSTFQLISHRRSRLMPNKYGQRSALRQIFVAAVSTWLEPLADTIILSLPKRQMLPSDSYKFELGFPAVRPSFKVFNYKQSTV